MGENLACNRRAPLRVSNSQRKILVSPTLMLNESRFHSTTAFLSLSLSPSTSCNLSLSLSPCATMHAYPLARGNIVPRHQREGKKNENGWEVGLIWKTGENCCPPPPPPSLPLSLSLSLSLSPFITGELNVAVEEWLGFGWTKEGGGRDVKEESGKGRIRRLRKERARAGKH